MGGIIKAKLSQTPGDRLALDLIDVAIGPSGRNHGAHQQIGTDLQGIALQNVKWLWNDVSRGGYLLLLQPIPIEAVGKLTQCTDPPQSGHLVAILARLLMTQQQTKCPLPLSLVLLPRPARQGLAAP